MTEIASPNRTTSLTIPHGTQSGFQETNAKHLAELTEEQLNMVSGGSPVSQIGAAVSIVAGFVGGFYR